MHVISQWILWIEKDSRQEREKEREKRGREVGGRRWQRQGRADSVDGRQKTEDRWQGMLKEIVDR